MKKLLIIRPKTVSPADKAKLTKDGYTVIEHPNPPEVRVVSEEEGIDGNAVLMAALKGVRDSIDGDGKFAKELIKRLYKEEVK